LKALRFCKPMKHVRATNDKTVCGCDMKR